MRKNVVRVDNENAVKPCNHEFPSAEEQWQPWESRAWLDVQERSLELTYAGPKVKCSRAKIVEPFFALSDSYLGTWCDVGFVLDPGMDLLVQPHHQAFVKSLPLAVPQLVAADQWHSRFLLIFKRSAFHVAPGDPLCQMLPVWRAQTEVASWGHQEALNGQKHGERLAEIKPTRTRNLGGEQIDNKYEMHIKRCVPSRTCPIIFKRGY